MSVDLELTVRSETTNQSVPAQEVSLVILSLHAENSPKLICVLQILAETVPSASLETTVQAQTGQSALVPQEPGETHYVNAAEVSS